LLSIYEICNLWGCIPATARKRAGDGTASGAAEEAVGLADDDVKDRNADADLEGVSRVKDLLIAGGGRNFF
jgi:hypothetical protein